MYTSVSHISRRPYTGFQYGGAYGEHITIEPDGRTASLLSNGDIDLYTPGSRVFARLHTDNCFTGQNNVFQGTVEMRRCLVTSDGREKANIQPLDAEAAAGLVQSLTPYGYSIDGESAAGLLAEDVPAAYVHRGPNGILSVDYNSLFTHLWAAVRNLQDRVTRLETGR